MVLTIMCNLSFESFIYPKNLIFFDFTNCIKVSKLYRCNSIKSLSVIENRILAVCSISSGFRLVILCYLKGNFLVLFEFKIYYFDNYLFIIWIVKPRSKPHEVVILVGRASFINFFWLTVLSTTVLSTKKRVFAKSQLYPLLDILLKIPFYPLFSQMKRLLARFVK